jgi:hypothetical protein
MTMKSSTSCKIKSHLLIPPITGKILTLDVMQIINNRSKYRAISFTDIHAKPLALVLATYYAHHLSTAHRPPTSSELDGMLRELEKSWTTSWGS